MPNQVSTLHREHLRVPIGRAIFQLSCFFLFLSTALKSRRSNALKWYAGSAVALVNLYLAHTNHAYIFLAVSILLFLLTSLNVKKNFLLLVFGGFILIFVFVDKFQSKFYGSIEVDYHEQISKVLSPDNLWRRFQTFIDGPKFELFDRIVFLNLDPEFFGMVLG